MSSERQSNTTPRFETESRWAPWWIYLLVIAPANVGKEQRLR